MKRAFTLIEIIVVIGIVGILAALLVPTFVRAKRSAKQSVSMSNLRQCGMALLIYADDEGDIPVGKAAFDALSKAPTCDPGDYWRSNCELQWGEPLIGSYGYIRLVTQWKDEAGWSEYKSSVERPPLLASVWYGDNHLDPFMGESPDPMKSLCDIRGTCWFPNRILYFRMDGSAYLSNRKKYSYDAQTHAGQGWLFTWPAVFERSLFGG